ncbi:MAG: phosphoribosylamine--glycine ligase [Phycisphaerae bacterium]
MKVLLIGNGGREHALAWKLAQSPRLTKLLCLPGNPGTRTLGENVDLDPMDFDRVEAFALKREVDLVVVGPEDPLAGGIVDRLRAAGLTVFGPGKAAARLEADKWFAKELMRSQAVPTAEAKVFSDPDAADAYVERHGAPLVVKAVGLAKGKGVTVCYREADAYEAIDAAMRRHAFDEAGGRVVIEDMLTGRECSVLALVSGRSLYVMPPCQDHKAVDDGDTGPMTGGMGAYCPTPAVDDVLMRQIERDVFIPTLDGLAREGIEFSGVLYAGLMLTAAGPKVLEFNCRFGDPETQPLMMRLKSDLLEVLLATAQGRLEEIEIEWDERPAVCVVAASGGYPGKYAKGHEITGLAEAAGVADTVVFHAGTRNYGEKILTDGGRVLGVTAMGADMASARANAYAALDQIHFEGMQARRDIAERL